MPRTLPALAAGLLVAAVLTSCTTSVTGTGRPGPAVSGNGGGSPSGGSSATSGPFDATGDAHEVWDRALDATTSTGGGVEIGGLISYADVDGAGIKGSYSTDDAGDAAANIVITTKAGELTILATGGEAWAEADDAAVYTAYGFSSAAAAQAAGKAVALTDDSSVLAPFTDLRGLLQLFGPLDADPATVKTGTFGSKHEAVIVSDDKYHTEVYLEPANGHAFAATAGDETVLLDETDTPPTVDAPDPSDVVTVDGF